MNPTDLTRRQILRGAGVFFALPALESTSLAGATESLPVASAPPASPLRTAFVYIPNGVNVAEWASTMEDGKLRLGASLESLQPFADSLQVVRQLGHATATFREDGAGDHARGNATFLTGARPKKTGGADIHVGVSVDQFAAQRIGQLTRFPSLELSCDQSRKSGACDSGYSCAYQFNLSWSTPTTPVAAESNPRLVFERLFADQSSAASRDAVTERRANRRSVLDFVLEESNRLRKGLPAGDRERVDQYLDGVRSIEQRIERAERLGERPTTDLARPEGVPQEYAQHVEIMLDLLAAAFESDVTRIGTFAMAHEGSNRSFKEIGVSDGHHYLSHHQGDEAKLEKIAKIDRFYAERFAYFLGRMQQRTDPLGRPLLESSQIVFGGGLADGNRHEHLNLPIVLAGGGAGRLGGGRIVQPPSDAPMNNLYVTMLRNMGVDAERFGDSTGAFNGVLRADTV